MQVTIDAELQSYSAVDDTTFDKEPLSPRATTGLPGSYTFEMGNSLVGNSLVDKSSMDAREVDALLAPGLTKDDLRKIEQLAKEVTLERLPWVLPASEEEELRRLRTQGAQGPLNETAVARLAELSKEKISRLTLVQDDLATNRIAPDNLYLVGLRQIVASERSAAESDRLRNLQFQWHRDEDARRDKASVELVETARRANMLVNENDNTIALTDKLEYMQQDFWEYLLKNPYGSNFNFKLPSGAGTQVIKRSAPEALPVVVQGTWKGALHLLPEDPFEFFEFIAEVENQSESGTKTLSWSKGNMANNIGDFKPKLLMVPKGSTIEEREAGATWEKLSEAEEFPVKWLVHQRPLQTKSYRS